MKDPPGVVFGRGGFAFGRHEEIGNLEVLGLQHEKAGNGKVLDRPGSAKVLVGFG